MKMKCLIFFVFVALSQFEESQSDLTYVGKWGDVKHFYRPLYPYAVGWAQIPSRGWGWTERPSTGWGSWSGSEVGHLSGCNCGIRNRHPNSEDDVEGHAGEIPWRCYLTHPKLNSFCGATIISSRWVLTAADCFNNFDKTDDNLDRGAGLTVTCGDHDRSSIKEISHVTLNADKIILHDGFDQDKNRNHHDIAVIRLSQELTWKDNVRPICLPFGGEGWDCEVKSTGVLASGWSSLTGSTEDVLKRSRISCLDRKKCKELHKKEDQEDRLRNPESVICTHKPGSKSCPGDWGASVDFAHTSGRYYAIGIGASKSGCDEDLPALSTRVTEYLDWIKRKTGERFCGDHDFH